MRITRKLGLKYLFLRIYGGALGICLTIGTVEKKEGKGWKKFSHFAQKKVFFILGLGWRGDMNHFVRLIIFVYRIR